MKKVIFIAIAALAALVSCSKEQPAAEEPKLSVDAAKLRFTAVDAPSQTIKVSANCDWEVSADESWVVLSTEKGSKDGSVVVAVTKNQGQPGSPAPERSSIIKFTYGNAFVEVDVIQEAEAQKNEFKAICESTKTTLEPSGKVYWALNDSINVLWNETTLKLAAQVAGETTTFSKDQVAEASKYYAIYPAFDLLPGDGTECDFQFYIPKTQHGTFAETNVAAAFTDATSNYFQFKNVCALVKFTISRTDIAEVRFRPSPDIQIVGLKSIKFNASGIPTVIRNEGNVEAVVTPASGNAFAPGTYYLGVAPVTCAQGVVFKVKKTDGSNLPFKTLSEAVTLERSTIKDFGVIDDTEIAGLKYYASVAGAGSKSGENWANALNVDGLKTILKNEDGKKLGSETTIYCAGGTYVFGSSTENYLALAFDASWGAKVNMEGGYNASTGKRDQTTTFSGDSKYAIFDVTASTNITFDGCTFANAISKDDDTPHRALVVNSSSAVVALNACKFTNNKETGAKGGPAIFVKSGKVYADDCIFEQNQATSQGGALRVEGDKALFFANNCVFYNNKIGASATYGSVMFVKGNVGFNACTFYGNNEPEGINQPVMNINSNVILTNNKIFGASNYNTGTGLIRCETAADYSAIAINNIMTNTYAGSNKSYAILYSKTNKTFVSGGYNMYAAQDASVSHPDNYAIATTDVEKKPADVTYSFDPANYTLSVSVSGYTPATKAQVKSAIESYTTPVKGITTVGPDFIAWLTELGEL